MKLCLLENCPIINFGPIFINPVSSMAKVFFAHIEEACKYRCYGAGDTEGEHVYYCGEEEGE